MNTGLISARYASALLQFALESKTADRVYEEATAITDVFLNVPELRHALDNPIMKAEDKRKLILSAVGGKAGETMEKFTDLLLKNKRENQLQYIMLKYIDLYRKENNINFGVLTTAHELDKATEERLVNLMGKKTEGKLELEKRIDPNILGGFKLEMNHTLWDASIAGQLKKLREEIEEQNNRVV